MQKDSKASVCSAYTTGNHAKQTGFPYPVSRVIPTHKTRHYSSLLVLKTCIPERNSMFLYKFNYGRPFSFLRHVTRTALALALSIWLSITDATECRFFATFWTSWSNLTVTSTLFTNYCKHSIHSSLQANGIFHLFLSLTKSIHHTYINIPF